jgi:taurine dioxygenase
MQQAVTDRLSVTARSFDTRELGPLVGLAIAGLDMSKPVAAQIETELKQLFLEYKILCFRDQALSLDQQVAFTRMWGTPLEHTMDGHMQAGAENKVQIASNAGPDGRPNGKHPDVTAMRWHTDRSWRKEPALATILHGIEVPREGGDTPFCDAAAAYRALPDSRKAELEPLKVIHSVEYSRRAAGGPPATEYELRIGPPVAHPLVRRHPETGEPALFLGSHAWKIEGMRESAGRALIDELTAYMTQDRFVYAHKWHRGDLLIWDNRCLLHRATPYDTTKELRTMHRTVVQGGPTS